MAPTELPQEDKEAGRKLKEKESRKEGNTAVRQWNWRTPEILRNKKPSFPKMQILRHTEAAVVSNELRQ